MGSQRTWRVAALVGATALVAACGSSSPSSSSSVPTQSGNITAGVIAPFTGPAAQFGKSRAAYGRLILFRALTRMPVGRTSRRR